MMNVHVPYSPNEQETEILNSYRNHLQGVAAVNTYEQLECSINLPNDASVLEQVHAITKTIDLNKLTYVFLIGIGGSNLGPRSVYDALFGYMDGITPDRYPKLITIDTCDPQYLAKLKTFINSQAIHLDEVLFNIITKSGTTTETIVNTEILINHIPEITNRMVITSGKDTKITQFAQQQNIRHLTLPDLVGGRYSIFSTVGLFPLTCLGVDVDALRKGAQTSLKDSLTEDLTNNPAALSAAYIYNLNQKHGYNIHDLFLFHPELETLGKWYRQLMAESIGKEKDSDGNVVHAGITPTVSIPANLHSSAQLSFGGPRDKITTFVVTDSVPSDITVPDTLTFPGLVSDIEGRKASYIVESMYKGVRTTYEKLQLPFIEVVLDTVSEESLGEFIQYEMMTMMYLAKLLNVNAFDQPSVELYKEETRKLLKDS